MIDDEDSPHKLAYQLTKPLKRGHIYNGEGTYKFVLQEVTATKFDNHELGIADYYMHFPDEYEENTDPGEDPDPNPDPIPDPEPEPNPDPEPKPEPEPGADEENEDRKVWL